ncbi:transposable element Tcb2 transposase [Trichonephila clavipes]|nr:transposable element Tcb2 transposase [Trichonephila clavipes]
MEAGWTARRVARQLGCSVCVVRCWDQWIQEIIYTKARLRTPSTNQSWISRRPPVVRNARVQPTTSSATLQAQLVPSLEAPVSSRTIRRRLAKGHLGLWCQSRVLPLTPTEEWTAEEWNQVVFNDESRFNLRSNDNRVRVWGPRGERLNPAFALQRHTAPTAGVMVWGVIVYNTRQHLVLIRGPMTSCNPMCCHSSSDS